MSSKPYAAQQPNVSPWRVLVADDDPDMCDLLAASLDAEDVNVEVAAGGPELKRHLQRVGSDHPPPDLIVSDIHMPGFSGFDALAWVRDHLPQTGVILITAFGDARTHERAGKLGAIAVFDKPFDIVQLNEKVRGALGST